MGMSGGTNDVSLVGAKRLKKAVTQLFTNLPEGAREKKSNIVIKAS